MTNLPARLILQQELPTAAERASGPLPVVAGDRAPTTRRSGAAGAFQPGLRVRVIPVEGREYDGLIRWDRESARPRIERPS